MTSALQAFGKVLRWNGQLVAEITKITLGGYKSTQIDVTNEDSTSGWLEKIGGNKDPGTISLEFNFIPGDTNGQIAMAADFASQVVRTATITYPPASATVLTVTGFLSDFKPIDGGLDDQLKGSATITITGAPSLAITASADLTTLTGIEENTGAALTFTPTFDGAVYEYNVAVNTASTWVKFTPTLTGATITINNGTTSQDVLSGAQSGTIALTDGAITNITLDVKETGKVAKQYKVHIYTP